MAQDTQTLFILKILIGVISGLATMLLSIVVFTIVSVIKNVGKLFDKTDGHETRISRMEGRND